MMERPINNSTCSLVSLTILIINSYYYLQHDMHGPDYY